MKAPPPRHPGSENKKNFLLVLEITRLKVSGHPRILSYNACFRPDNIIFHWLAAISSPVPSCVLHITFVSIFFVFLLDTSIYLKAYGEVFWLQLFTSMAWNWWVLKVANLQSWVKSEFCTLSPTESLSCGFGTAMSPPLIPPWLMLFTGGQKWSSHTLTLFSWGKGEVFVVSRVHCWPQVFQLNYCHELFT